MKKVAVITGFRGEYGYIKPVLRKIERDPELDYSLVVTDMHLLPEFGRSVEEIEKDGFKISDKIYTTLDGYTHATMVKSLGIFLMQIVDIFERLKSDIILISGDRGVQMMAAIAGAYMYIPVAHIQAGEISGNIDDTCRHAITKFSHIHFAATEGYAERVRRLGEEEFRIKVVGAPLLDDLLNEETPDIRTIEERLHIKIEKPLFLVIQHPVTEQAHLAEKQMEETMKALIELGGQCIIIYPNSDAGNTGIIRMIEKYRMPFMHVCRNLPRDLYAGLLNTADVMIGNSSSGIMEAPSFSLPVANIGTRERGREQARNVINVGHNKDEIVKAVQFAMSKDFRKKAERSINPYGDGKASERIVKILKEIEINEELVQKKITY